jgi:hypothetical protein
MGEKKTQFRELVEQIVRSSNDRRLQLGIANKKEGLINNTLSKAFTMQLQTQIQRKRTSTNTKQEYKLQYNKIQRNKTKTIQYNTIRSTNTTQ